MLTVDIHGELVCGGASDGSCTVWSLRTGRERARLTGHQQKVKPCVINGVHTSTMLGEESEG